MATPDRPAETLETLREENTRLREEVAALRRERSGFSRRVLLGGGAGAVAATAGLGLLGPVTGVIAAPTARRTDAVPAAIVPGSRLPTQFFIQIVGSKQGRLIGDLDGDGLPDLIVGYKVDHRASSARDAASGLPTGRRQYQPFVIVKEWGASSPQLAQAFVTNEILTSVNLYFQKQVATGGSGIVYQIQLQNAQMTRFRQYVGDVGIEEETLPRILEEVAFTFQTIRWTSLTGKTTYQDDWQTQST